MPKFKDPKTDEELMALAEKDLRSLPLSKIRELRKRLNELNQRQRSNLKAAAQRLAPRERRILEQHNQFLDRLGVLAEAFSSLDRGVIDGALGQFDDLREQRTGLLDEMLPEDPWHPIIHDGIANLDRTEKDMQTYKRMIYGDGKVQ